MCMLANLGSVDKFVKTMNQVIVEKLVIFDKCLIGEKPVTAGRPVPPYEPLGTSASFPIPEISGQSLLQSHY